MLLAKYSTVTRSSRGESAVYDYYYCTYIHHAHVFTCCYVITVENDKKASGAHIARAGQNDNPVAHVSNIAAPPPATTGRGGLVGGWLVGDG